MIGEEDFRGLFDLAADAMFILDQDRLIREINHIAYQQIGYTKAEMLGRHIGDFIPPGYAAMLKSRFSKVQNQGYLIYESAMVHKDGSILPVEICNRAIELDGKQTFFAVVRDISERKRLDSALRESEARFRTLSEDAPEAIVIHDLESGLFVDATTSAERLFGCSRDAILRHGPQYFYAPDQPVGAPSFESIRERGERIMAGEQMKFERLVRNCNGQDILCEVRLVRLPSTNRKLVRASYLDISERKKAEEELQTSERNYRELMEQAGDAITVADHEGRRYLDVNRAACDLFGYTREEFLGLGLRDLFHPDDLINSSIKLEELWAGQVVQTERRLRRKDGSFVTVEMTAKMLSDGRLLSIKRDITVREAVLTELKKSEAWFRSIFENVNTGIASTDSSGRVTSFNEAFCTMLGYDADALARMNFADFTHPDDLKLEIVFFDEILAGKRNHYHITKRYIANHGRILWVDLSAAAIRDADGKVANFVAVIQDITDRKAAEDEIEHLAFYDPLTRLPNRRLLLDRLYQALVSSTRSGRAGALLFIDLDNFKNLNDTLGHDIGDLLLQQIAQRLGTCIREGDTEARLGGDEFVVMLLGLSGQPFEAAAQAEGIGEKILATLSQPYQLDTHVYHCTASIGVTLFSDNQQATDDLMKQADIAMYQAKKAGRNTLRFFDRQMQESISARVSMENELHNALEFQQFHLYYQIQVDNSLRPLGAEALIRWIHPVRGTVSPAQFIPLAEETGLILPIGQWVLDTACAQIKAWQQNMLARELTLAVNVSAKQFHQVDFVAQVQAAVQHHAINPKLLKLELTESLLLENIDATIATMSALNDIGVQLALDDFGTGYSSLQYLKRLPLDQLKIDQSFVRDISIDSSDKAIVRTIIAMAQSLDLEVIAEGVETEEQRQFLLKYGCTRYQGYLFGRPVPVEQFQALLKEG